MIEEEVRKGRCLYDGHGKEIVKDILNVFLSPCRARTVMLNPINHDQNGVQSITDDQDLLAP